MALFNFFKPDQRQLAIVYFFLSAEHRMSDTDYSVFEELGASKGEFTGNKPMKSIFGPRNIIPWKEAKGEIIGECEKLLAQEDSAKTRCEIVSDAFKEYVEDLESDEEYEEQRSCLWMLIGLLYQPGIYSESRERLISLWQENSSEISESMYAEMVDAAKTLNAINEHKERLGTMYGLSYGDASSMQVELDKNIKDIQTSVNDLITLG
jgi:hypothetical protein